MKKTTNNKLLTYKYSQSLRVPLFNSSVFLFPTYEKNKIIKNRLILDNFFFEWDNFFFFFQNMFTTPSTKVFQFYELINPFQFNTNNLLKYQLTIFQSLKKQILPFGFINSLTFFKTNNLLKYVKKFFLLELLKIYFNFKIKIFYLLKFKTT